MLKESGVENQPKVFGLDSPGRESAVKNLSRILGEEQAKKLWNSTCYKLNVSPSTTNMVELEKVFKQISLMDGSVGVCGKSLVVIAMTFKNLNGVK